MQGDHGLRQRITPIVLRENARGCSLASIALIANCSTALVRSILRQNGLRDFHAKYAEKYGSESESSVFSSIYRTGKVDENFEPSQLDPNPTTEMVGTPEKIEVLRMRVSMGYELWHPKDNPFVMVSCHARRPDREPDVVSTKEMSGALRWIVRS